jgi:hypothetical protein
MKTWAVLLLACVGCTSGGLVTSAKEEARALAISKEYLSYGRIDDELRWAPDLCRIPLPGVARMSQSSDSDTHGNKLFSLLVKDRIGYPDNSKIGQVIVKESFAAERATDGTVYDPDSYPYQPNATDHFYPYAKKGDIVYKAGAPLGLYMMYRDAEIWSYAIVTPDNRVAVAGRIDACVNCHKNAPNGELFGVSPSHYPNY